jgi:hypothetical protein
MLLKSKKYMPENPDSVSENEQGFYQNKQYQQSFTLYNDNNK